MINNNKKYSVRNEIYIFVYNTNRNKQTFTQIANGNSDKPMALSMAK